MRRRSVPVLIAVVLAVGLTLVAAPGRAAADALWLRPVPGPVVRVFRPPLTRFGRGHLGIDFTARPGTPVHAAGPGTVVFAGPVANVLHVVVLHEGGLRTSYSYLASVRVRRGQPVRRGAVLGTTGGSGENHGGRVLHFALRIGPTFVDPMQLFTTPDLAARVHLEAEPTRPGPADGRAPAAAAEQRSLAAGLPGPRFGGNRGRYTDLASGPIPAAQNQPFARP